MKSTQIVVNIYEIGDLLDVSNCSAKHAKPALNEAERALVINVKNLKYSKYGYDVLTDKGMKVSITPDEIGDEKYIRHLDLSALFGADE